MRVSTRWIVYFKSNRTLIITISFKSKFSSYWGWFSGCHSKSSTGQNPNNSPSSFSALQIGLELLENLACAAFVITKRALRKAGLAIETGARPTDGEPLVPWSASTPSSKSDWNSFNTFDLLHSVDSVSMDKFARNGSEKWEKTYVYRKRIGPKNHKQILYEICLQKQRCEV